MPTAPPSPSRHPTDFEGFETQWRGHKFEDFAAGQVFDHHWGRTLTESDVVLFATATCQWNPLYLNREYAKAHGHPDLVVPPLLILCTVVGLSVEDLSEIGGPFLGVNECSFSAPLHIGDTVTARSEVLSARLSKSHPGAGIVSWRTDARDQTGDVVLTFVRANLVACHVGSPDD